jgi:hypothetical protein
VNEEGPCFVGTLTTRVPLDRERKSEYLLTVVAEDTVDAVHLQSHMDVIVLVVDKNDHAPTSTSPHVRAHVSEDAPSGTLVAKIDATDRDRGSADGLNYQIARGDPQSFFHIDSATGA